MRSAVYACFAICAALTACCDGASLASDGDRHLVTWNVESGSRACVVVPAELLESLRSTNGDGGVADPQVTAVVARELALYRLCEAYGNGVISSEEYRRAVLGVPSP